MKSILSKTVKYPKSKPNVGNTKTTVAPIPNRSRIDIHEISTQSIMQTSALLHMNNQNNNQNTSIIITPTNESIVGEPFRSLALEDDDDSNDSDTVQSNGASVSDDDDSNVVVVVDDVADINQKSSRHASLASFQAEPNDMVISEECSIRVSSPLGEPKEVRFLGEEDRIMVPKISFDDSGQDDDAAVHRHMVRFHEDEEQQKESFVLHGQLRNVLQDLSAEKAVRFQKEKSLVKLAKQLKKRNQAIDVYETKLIQMAKFINTLQLELHQLREENVREKQRWLSEEMKSSAATKEHSAIITSLRNTIQSLRTELQESLLQSKMLKDQNLPKIDETHIVESKVLMTTSHSTTTMSRLRPYVMMAFVFGLSSVAVMLYHAKTANMVQNVLCAPIRPGTRLMPNTSTGIDYEAPWWVPSSTNTNLKPIIHSTFCSNVPRTSLHWTGDKLMIFDITSEDQDSRSKKVLLLQGRGPAGVQFHHISDSNQESGNTIQLLRTNRAGIALPAPWML